MPDLPEDLTRMLGERAADAPATPAPSPGLVARVRRRQAVRAALAVAGCTVAVVGIVAVAGSALNGNEAAPPAGGAPAAPLPTASPADDRYEFCTGPVADEVHVAVHPTEPKFDAGCYRVRAGAMAVTFTNPQRTPHDLVITRDGDRGYPVFTGNVISAADPKAGPTCHLAQRCPSGVVPFFHADLATPFAAGDYTLTCSIHPQMRAQLVVR
jgi:plastocyanin